MTRQPCTILRVEDLRAAVERAEATTIVKKGEMTEAVSKAPRTGAHIHRLARASRMNSNPRTRAMKTETKRAHRAADDRIAELEEKIAAIRAREAAKEAKARPEAQPLVQAVRALDKAGRVAEGAGNGEVLRAVEAARAALAPAVVGIGLRLPEGKARRGRKPKGVA